MNTKIEVYPKMSMIESVFLFPNKEKEQQQQQQLK